MDRFDLVKESFMKKEVPACAPAGKTSDYYGELVFDRKKMCKYLDADSLQALLACIEGGKPLDRKTADGVARGMKEWAIEHGVTHVTHWFQPLTEGTAEKHDSLIESWTTPSAFLLSLFPTQAKPWTTRPRSRRP